MNFEKELRTRKMNIRTCSLLSGIPYATLYPIIKGQVDIGTCEYYTVAKLARTLGYRPDEIVYIKEDFQTFRNNLHHELKDNELELTIEVMQSDRVEYYARHEDYVPMLYLIAMMDYVCNKNGIPLCDKYDEYRKLKLKEPYFVGDNLSSRDKDGCIEEFVKYNIYEGDLYDAV